MHIVQTRVSRSTIFSIYGWKSAYGEGQLQLCVNFQLCVCVCVCVGGGRFGTYPLQIEGTTAYNFKKLNKNRKQKNGITAVKFWRSKQDL